MKRAIFTLCTKFEINKAAVTGGFLDFEAYACSIILSIMLAKQNVGRVEVYTDSAGKRLIDSLGLPVDEFHVVYDEFDYPHPLWVASKLLTFSVQKEPFIHLDLDAYLWEPLPERLANAAVIMQSSENGWQSYPAPAKHLMENAGWLPEFITAHWEQNKGVVYAANAGAYGGQDVDTIRTVSKAALETIDHVKNKPMFEAMLQNYDAHDKVFWSFPILLEQYYMGVYCHLNNIDLRYVLSEKEPPYFTHLMAESKRNVQNTVNLKNRVRVSYPDQFATIASSNVSAL